MYGLQKLQDEIEKSGSKMKQHEDNIKFLKAQKNQLDDAILDVQGIYNDFLSLSLLSWEKFCTCLYLDAGDFVEMKFLIFWECIIVYDPGN